MKLTLEKMNKGNLKDIFDFEVENRAFFESVVPKRPNGYFNIESFKKLMDDILIEQSQGDCLMCIIRDESSKVVGRVNLGNIKREEVVKADLGYRISESELGKGYASRAVQMIIELALKEYRVKVFTAGSASTNIGSQKVLLKNGFNQTGQEENVMMVNGDWVDGLLFEKIIT